MTCAGPIPCSAASRYQSAACLSSFGTPCPEAKMIPRLYCVASEPKAVASDPKRLTTGLTQPVGLRVHRTRTARYSALARPTGRTPGLAAVIHHRGGLIRVLGRPPKVKRAQSGMALVGHLTRIARPGCWTWNPSLSDRPCTDDRQGCPHEFTGVLTSRTAQQLTRWLYSKNRHEWPHILAGIRRKSGRNALFLRPRKE